MTCYDPKGDFIWLICRPLIWLPRLIQVSSSFLIFVVNLLIYGSSQKERVQRNLAQNLFSTFTSLGPCFIKLGQALSTRPDLVRRDWLEELSNLQDNLPPFPQDVALDIFENELGISPYKIFKDFRGEPVAAASLGQVYKARLYRNYWVAVKIQRPNLEFIIRRDLVLIRFFGKISAPFLPLNLGFSLTEIIDEFAQSLFEEIDYEQEARNAERFSNLFSENPTITIPKVEYSLSSKKVITTSWIEGVKLRSREDLEAHHLDPKAIIRTAVISAIQQLLEFGYFHADPHPGNIFALRGKSGKLGHLAYVDFGMMDSISDYDRISLVSAVVHLINRDFCELANDFKILGFLSPSTDIKPIIPVLENVLGAQLIDSVNSFNFKKITNQFSALMYDYPFRVPARFALIIRAVVSQEGLALRLDPNFRILAIAYPYVVKRLLMGDTEEMIEILLEVIFDSDGHLKLQRIESLLSILTNPNSDSKDELLPLAASVLKLLLSEDGSKLRKAFLMALIKDDRIDVSDFKKLIRLLKQKIGNEFSLGTSS